VHSLLAFSAPYRKVLAGGAALMLCESAAALAVPWMGGILADTLLSPGAAAANLGTVLLALLALFAFQALLKFGSTYLVDSVADRIVADLRVRLFDHLQSLPLAFFHRSRLGDSLALLTTDVYVIAGFISGTALLVAPLMVTAIGAIILMFGIRPDLALLACLLMPLFFLLTKIVGRRLRPLSVRLQNEEAGAVSMAQENLGMLPAIKAFTREAHESSRFRSQMQRILGLSMRQRRIYAGMEPLVHFVAAAGMIVVLALAGNDLAEGRMSPAQLVSFLLYAMLLARPIAGLADVYGRTQGMRGALARLQAALEESPEPAAGIGKSMPAARGEIEYRGVCFSYPGRPPALEGVNLRITAGETVAIVGPNGAGKSSLAHLLLRLHEPSSGCVLVDGIDISSVSLRSLRRQVGIVPQHVLLFNASVRDNIAYGREEADQPAIEAAAKAAGAHEFIVALPQGYDTPIGDRGVRLSGGQQQRLALARALLKDPPILILDEATSMFDPQGEADFLEACRDRLRRRTVILITHRPNSLATADRIIRLNRGRIETTPRLQSVA
jgi:ATP-binding cassette subfamily B protein